MIEFYRVIEGKVEVGKALTRLPFNMICFTGSTQTGRLVAIEAAKNLTPCILELGGKCPVIVD
jgi:acyl-CoA reductase-like NAD-dependent aldehyde dehydrogenase